MTSTFSEALSTAIEFLFGVLSTFPEILKNCFSILFTYIEPAMVWEITLGQMICFFLGIGYVKFNDYLNNRRVNHES